MARSPKDRAPQTLPDDGVERLTLCGDLEVLPELTRWLENVVIRRHYAPTIAFAMQLCLEEAVANIVMHGAKPAPRIEIQLFEESGVPFALVEDDGIAFDPTLIAADVLPTSPEEAPVGGYGMHLIRGFASQTHYSYTNRRNRLTLIFAEDGSDGTPAAAR